MYGVTRVTDLCPDVPLGHGVGVAWVQVHGEVIQEAGPAQVLHTWAHVIVIRDPVAILILFACVTHDAAWGRTRVKGLVRSVDTSECSWPRMDWKLVPVEGSLAWPWTGSSPDQKCSGWSKANFSCSLTRDMTAHNTKNLAFHRFLRWEMIILVILTTSLRHFSVKGWENVLFELGSERVKGHRNRVTSGHRKSVTSSS